MREKSVTIYILLILRKSLKSFSFSNKMMTNVAKKVPKSSDIFVCEICDYSTSRKSQYDRHLLTAKHKNVAEMFTNLNFLGPKSSKNIQYNCLCGKTFSYRQSLYVHKKKCSQEESKNNLEEPKNNLEEPKNNLEESKNNPEESKNNLEESKNNPEEPKNNPEESKNSQNYEPITKELIMQLIQQNQNLQEMLHEQHNKMFEIAKEGKIITTNNNNINNTTNNTQFNLNVFLNETCKDAINMSDFIDSLNVNLKDLEYTAKTSYAEGISKIFINGLASLNVPDRPLHCSDTKRDTIYIKDQDTWEKDDETKTKLTKAIKIVGHKNMKQIVEWQKANPEYNDPDSKQNDRYQEMLCNAMCGSTKEESVKNYEKIIKNIAKEVVIDKQTYR